MEHLVLIDGHHLMYRAYWAIPRTLTTRAGEQVNAVFGFASMLLTILKQEQPTHLIVCFDVGGDTFRHQENDTYKDGRAATPDDFYTQIPRMMEFVAVCGIAQVSDARYEADDFLCAYAKTAEEAGMRVTIVTGDRDAFQLATDRVRIAIPHSAYRNAEYLGPADIKDKYGIRPDQVPAYKGLTGDPSDNLPGVRGIGPKTAAELLQRYDTLERVYDHVADIRPAVRAKLEADREQAFFCQHMARLVCDMPLPLALDAARIAAFPAEQILAWFQAIEFTLLGRRLTELLRTPYGRELAPSFDSDAAAAASKQQMTLF